jgi:hypothetical protein
MKVSEQIEAVKQAIDRELPDLLISGKDCRIIISAKRSKATVEIIPEIKEVWNTKCKVYQEHIQENT